MCTDVVFGPSYDIGNSYYQYSSNPQTVAHLAETVRQAWENAGLMAVPKHFPGLRVSGGKTHKAAVYYNVEDYKEGLIPFEAAIKNGARAIMIGHGRYQRDEKRTVPPATFSEEIILDLRNRLGFKGIIIADEVLQMEATRGGEVVIVETDPRKVFANRYLSAIAAGNDMVILFTLMPEDKLIEELARGVDKAIAQGILSLDRINESVMRVLKLKQNYYPDHNFFKSKDTGEIIKDMTLQEKVAQTLILEFNGRGADAMPVGMYMPRQKMDAVHFVKDMKIPVLLAADQRIHYSAESTDKLFFPQEVGAEYAAVAGAVN